MRLQLTWVLELTSIRFQFKPKHAKFKIAINTLAIYLILYFHNI